MDTASVVSETFEEECRFLAIGHDAFMELGSAEGPGQAQTSMPSAALVDVVTGSLSLSTCVSITADGPAAGGPLSSAYNVQPTLVSRAGTASVVATTNAAASQQGLVSSQQMSGPVAVINMSSWMQQDCFDCFPASPGLEAFTSNNNVVSETEGFTSNIVPFVPGKWPATPWRAATSEGGRLYAQAPSRWLATLEEQQCFTPVTTSNAIVTAPGAPLPPRGMRA